MAQKPTTEKDALARSIEARERSIKRMEENIRKEDAAHQEWIAETRARITEKKVLLDALKRGRLKK